jgi:RNA polymerase Rpb5, N-terminal domain
MSDVDEAARMWKVNRTIHELVRDRVSYLIRAIYQALTCGFDIGILGI